MTSEDAVLTALEQLGIAYMVVGSFASNYYGVPRSTQDADLVVVLGDHSPREIADLLGAAFRLDPQLAFETMTMTTHFNFDVVDCSFKIELFLLSDDPYDQERFQRRRRWRLLGRDVYLLTPEDVIVTKLRWAVRGGREKDIADVRDVIAIQGSAIDWPYVELWTAAHGSGELLADIRRSIPPPGGGAP
jgi:hypothetical protein